MTHTLPADWLLSLEGKCRLITGPKDATEMAFELKQRFKDTDGIFSLLTIPITRSVLDQAPKLRVVSNMAVGVDNIEIPACTERRIPVGNTPGVLTEATADLTMTLLLAAARGIYPAIMDARQGKWKTWSPTGWLGTDLDSTTLGIIGMGKIGRAVAQRALGFGMRIIYTDPQPVSYSYATQVPLDQLLAESDIITLHIPLTAQTRGLINSKAIKLMKPSAILVNASRGPVVNTEDLYTALVEHKITAAALDVTDPEPLPPSHPLYSLSNCIILPHIGSATRQTRKRMAELACDNLLAGLEGKPLPNCVNPEVYQR